MAKIKVLWIDDECLDMEGKLTSLGRELVETLDEKGIDIKPEPSFEKGKETLKNNPKKFHAVILNVCNKNNESEEESSDDFHVIRDTIKKVQGKNDGLPYFFVLSGLDNQYIINTLPPGEDYWPDGIKFYNKRYRCNCYEQLSEDIIKAVDNSFRYKCERDYEDVLEASRVLFGKEGYNRLLDIICAILEESKKKEQNPDKFNAMRKIFEDILTTLKNNGYSYFKKNPSVKLSLNGLSYWIQHKDKDVPIYIKHAYNVALDETQKGSHSLDVLEEIGRDVEKGLAPYLLRSCLFELLNFILWVKKWVDAQGIVPQQIIKQPNKKPTKLSRNDFDKKDYIVTSMDNFCCVGNKFILSNECKEQEKVKVGDKIQILEVDINDDIIAKDNYPYIATKIVKIETT